MGVDEFVFRPCAPDPSLLDRLADLVAGHVPGRAAGLMAGGNRRWFVALLIGATLLQASTAVARPMASYRALDIGMTASSLGLLAAAFAIAPVAFALSIGRLIDRFGESRFLLGASVMLAAASFGLAFVGFRPWAARCSWPCLGLAQLVFVVSNQTAVSNRTAAEPTTAGSGTSRSWPRWASSSDRPRRV